MLWGAIVRVNTRVYEQVCQCPKQVGQCLLPNCMEMASQAGKIYRVLVAGVRADWRNPLTRFPKQYKCFSPKCLVAM